METENISSGSGMHGMHHRRNIQMLLNPHKRRTSIAPGETVKTGGLIAMVMDGHGKKHRNIIETFENGKEGAKSSGFQCEDSKSCRKY